MEKKKLKFFVFFCKQPWDPLQILEYMGSHVMLNATGIHMPTIKELMYHDADMQFNEHIYMDVQTN
jgi:hypothetical protein